MSPLYESIRMAWHRKGVGVIAACAVTLVLLLTAACGTNRNTAMSRQWQAFTTRYNVYYNGDEHYKEQLKAMERDYEDDYTRKVLMHPAEARADNKRPQPSGDFKRTIEKMQKSIQLHSISKKPTKRAKSQKDKEFRNREEFNPFLHNAWLMMGRSQYYNGDFLGAASTFFYIQRHFKWKPEVVAEAQLWQALSYCALDWTFEAENILVHIKRDKLPNSNLANLYDYVEADYLIRASRYEEAIPFLESAAKHASGSQRNRLYFLLGQLYSDLGKKDAAYKAFGKAGSGAGTNYRTKFNARIKQSEVYTGRNVNKEISALKSMTRYGRNNEYLDQIYYAIGNLYLTRKDSVNAEKNYRLAVEKSTRAGIDKALAQLALGRILFDKHDYVGAQPCYSEAVPLLPDNYPDYKQIKNRSDVLDQLAEYAGNVHLQDSLLTLARMPEAERLKACQKLAKDYEEKMKKEAADAKREEYLSQQGAQGSQINDANAPTQFQINTDKSWYFYNTQTKNQGKAEFARRWGSRKNEDDWRRRNKNTFSLDTFEEELTDDTAEMASANDSISDEDKKRLAAEADPTKAEYYLKDIPKTDTEIATCNDIIQEGLYNMGVILKDKLEDYPQARSMFMRLETRYPDNVYRLDVYYNMYLMAVRQDNNAEAEKWRGLILSDFPESNYGQAMRDPNYFENLRRMNDVQEELYQQAYQAYLNNNNAKVHQITQEMETDYPLSKILPKFIFIDALSYVTERDDAKFKERLEQLLQKWPDTDMTETASNMLKYASSGRKLAQTDGNTRGLIWETRLISSGEGDGAKTEAAGGTPAKFDLDPNKPQLLVLAFPLDSINPNQLLFEVARFNFSSFVVKDFDLEQMSFGNIGLLIIKGFNNMKELEHYRTVMERTKAFTLPPEVRPIMISDANFKLLLREGRSFEEYFDFEAKEKERKTEEKVVGEDNYLPGGPNDPEASQESSEAEEKVEQGESGETEISESAETESSEPAEEIENTPEEEKSVTAPETFEEEDPE